MQIFSKRYSAGLFGLPTGHNLNLELRNSQIRISIPDFLSSRLSEFPASPSSIIHANAHARRQSRCHADQCGLFRCRCECVPMDVYCATADAPCTTVSVVSGAVSPPSGMVSAHSDAVYAHSGSVRAHSAIVRAPSDLVSAHSAVVSAYSGLVSGRSDAARGPYCVVSVPSAIVSASFGSVSGRSGLIRGHAGSGSGCSGSGSGCSGSVSGYSGLASARFCVVSGHSGLVSGRTVKPATSWPRWLRQGKPGWTGRRCELNCWKSCAWNTTVPTCPSPSPRHETRCRWKSSRCGRPGSSRRGRRRPASSCHASSRSR